MANLSSQSAQNSGAVPKQGRRKALSKTRLLSSFRYAWDGLSYVWTHEPNFRIECLIGLAACLLALWLGVSTLPVLLISALVLALELLNSALEALVDLVSPDTHPLAGRVKDAAAGAVLLTSGLAVVVGLWHLGPPLWARVLAWL